MRRVTKTEFFDFIGPRNVNPRVDAASLRNRIHVSHWELQPSRQVVGLSKSDGWGVNATEFYLLDGRA
jgi:hypothetical protein